MGFSEINYLINFNYLIFKRNLQTVGFWNGRSAMGCLSIGSKIMNERAKFTLDIFKIMSEFMINLSYLNSKKKFFMQFLSTIISVLFCEIMK